MGQKVTIRQLAEQMGVCERTIKRWKKSGQLDEKIAESQKYELREGMRDSLLRLLNTILEGLEPDPKKLREVGEEQKVRLLATLLRSLN